MHNRNPHQNSGTLSVFLKFGAKNEASRFASTARSKAMSKKPCEYVAGGEIIVHRNMIPGTGELRRAILVKQLAMVAAGACWLVSTTGLASADNWPKFRKGIWQFERTLALTGREFASDEDRVVFKREMRRCVDPSEAMRETFRPVSVGNCHSQP